MPMESGRYPPSEVHIKDPERRVAMETRLPVHLWAVLSRGREADSVKIELVVTSLYHVIVNGVGRRERWRECDGERDWERRGEEGPRERCTVYFVQRMAWVKRGGV